MESLFSEVDYMNAPSIYDTESIESLKEKIQEMEKKAEQYTAERSAAEKNARMCRKHIQDMQNVLLRKLQAPTDKKVK